MKTVTKSLFRTTKISTECFNVNYKCSKSINSTACKIINYFPPSLQSCVTEAKATGTLRAALKLRPHSCSSQDKGTGWSVLRWGPSPHFLREILWDSKPEMTWDSSDKLTSTCQMVKALPQNIP